MRKLGMFLVLASLAGAQGGEQTSARLLLQATAGPGFIQTEFVGTLRQALTDEFTALRADRMLASLRRQKLKPRDVVRLMNGKHTRSTLKRYFGAGGKEIDRVDKALEASVERKDRKFFFGVMLYTMVKEFGLEPTAEFCQQTCAARTEISAADFKRLRQKVRSKSLMRECFDLQSRDDQKYMLEILRRMDEAPFLNHPLCASLGMDHGPFRPQDFPQLEEGMPGHGGEFTKGEAGGLPFDAALPPCPFFGRNLEESFEARGRRFGRNQR